MPYLFHPFLHGGTPFSKFLKGARDLLTLACEQFLSFCSPLFLQVEIRRYLKLVDVSLLQQSLREGKLVKKIFLCLGSFMYCPSYLRFAKNVPGQRLCNKFAWSPWGA